MNTNQNRRQAIFALVSAAALAALSPTALAQSAKPVLNLFCWSEYVPEAVIKGFEKETGIKVNVENYDSNEKMLAKLLAGGAKYDLIQPSEYVVESLIKQDKLEPIDSAAIEGFKNLRSGQQVFRSLDARHCGHRGEHREDQRRCEGLRRCIQREIQKAHRRSRRQP